MLQQNNRYDTQYKFFFQEPHTHDEGGIKVTTRKGEKGEDHHKIIHKFEIDPFIIKLNMDITCRILDDTKDPKKPSTSISHQEGDIKIHKVSRYK